MKHKLIWLVALLPGLALLGPSATAQDFTTKGSVVGTVVDSTGAIVPGATITVTGPAAVRTTVTDAKGAYEVANLIPGQYTVKASLTGFKSASLGDVTVFVGKSASVKLTLSTGDIAETIEVTGGSVDIDTANTAVGSNINSQVFDNLPVARRVDNVFYLAPGVTESQAGGRANPSISGGSALDNSYIADGVNITDSAFGGLGVFSRSYGTLGVGINTAFISEVQVKTGGFEPQYGQAEGGIVNIITKSGGREWRGSVFGFMQPGGLEATRKQPDATRVNKVGELRHEQNYDYGFDLGGPLVKDKLFFYGNFDPSTLKQTVASASNSGLASAGELDRTYTTYNYSAKLDWNLAASHQINFSLFGDPSHSNAAIQGGVINSDNSTNASKLDYGTRNAAVRYNGVLSNTWTLNITGSQGKNHFDETGFADYNQIVDRTQPARGNFNAIGLGFIEPTDGTTYRGTIDTTKEFSLAGNHSFSLGYQYQHGEYSGTRDRSGPHYEVPATNADGTYTQNPTAVGQPLNAAWSLRLASPTCTLCPLVNRGGVLVPVYLRQDRGEFGTPVFDTFSKYNAYYVQDKWKMGKSVTWLLGLRGEQERIEGNPGSTGKRVAYSFTGQWSPRLGVTIDPAGQGKTKVYYNFGRFMEYIPLDMAERSLSSEKDYTGGRFAPEYTIDSQGRRIAVINQYGTVNPVVDDAHLLNKAAGGTGAGISLAAQDPTSPILPGTKLGMAQEHVVGFEQRLPANLVFSARYLNRQLKRIVEDAGLNPPEGTSFFSGTTYFIGNVSSKLDAGTNIIEHTYNPGDPLPAGCDPSLDAGLFIAPGPGHTPKGACFEAKGANGRPPASTGADGLPDGFADPIHKYQAVEIELNKRFSHGWQMLANWRIAKVEGNYEGHFRNDNGQTDPAISSLFDFTAGELGLLGDQFAVGPLNTDRKHIVNLYGSYAFKGGQSLNVGGGVHMETGVPISQFYAHPIYLNAGEIPVGGRGALGRSETDTRVDLHLDYPIHFSSKGSRKLVISADFFNLFNSQPIRRTDQFVESTFGQNNPDFTQPGYQPGFGPRGVLTAYYPPFSMRFGLKLDF